MSDQQLTSKQWLRDLREKIAESASLQDACIEDFVSVFMMIDEEIGRASDEPSALPRISLGTMYGIKIEDPECWQAIDIGDHLAAVLVCMKMSDDEEPSSYGAQIVQTLLSLGYKPKLK